MIGRQLIRTELCIFRLHGDVIEVGTRKIKPTILPSGPDNHTAGTPFSEIEERSDDEDDGKS
jgi:hypothetical protein